MSSPRETGPASVRKFDQWFERFERLQARDEKLFGRQRQFDRIGLNRPIDIRCGEVERKVWSLDISRSGMSFITETPLKMVRLQLALPTEDGTPIWIEGEIVRERVFPGEELWEYGVCFVKRCETEQCDDAEPVVAAT